MHIDNSKELENTHHTYIPYVHKHTQAHTYACWGFVFDMSRRLIFLQEITIFLKIFMQI